MLLEIEGNWSLHLILLFYHGLKIFLHLYRVTAYLSEWIWTNIFKMLSCITHISYLSYADWWHLTWAHKSNQITQDRASLFIFIRTFGIGRKNTIRWIILRLKFVHLKGFEMRESYESYYLIVVLILFVLVPKLRQFTEVKFPRILGKKGFSLVSTNSFLIPLFESP